MSLNHSDVPHQTDKDRRTLSAVFLKDPDLHSIANPAWYSLLLRVSSGQEGSSEDEEQTSTLLPSFSHPFTGIC